MVSNPAKRPERPPLPEPKPPELPRIVRLLALARKWRAQIDRGEIRTRAGSSATCTRRRHTGRAPRRRRRTAWRRKARRRTHRTRLSFRRAHPAPSCRPRRHRCNRLPPASSAPCTHDSIIHSQEVAAWMDSIHSARSSPQLSPLSPPPACCLIRLLPPQALSKSSAVTAQVLITTCTRPRCTGVPSSRFRMRRPRCLRCPTQQQGQRKQRATSRSLGVACLLAACAEDERTPTVIPPELLVRAGAPAVEDASIPVVPPNATCWDIGTMD